MQPFQYLRVQSFINLFQNYGYKTIIATYCTRPKKFHEALFDKVREVRKKTEEKSFEPAKLHMVKRIKPLSGLPYWEKLLLRKIGLEENYPGVSIVKNTPSINKLLWEVKHAVRVVPITFPNGYPKEGDYSGTYLYWINIFKSPLKQSSVKDSH